VLLFSDSVERYFCTCDFSLNRRNFTPVNPIDNNGKKAIFFRAKVENLTSIKKKCFYLSIGCIKQI
jgi:hypothetical protein